MCRSITSNFTKYSFIFSIRYCDEHFVYNETYTDEGCIENICVGQTKSETFERLLAQVKNTDPYFQLGVLNSNILIDEANQPENALESFNQSNEWYVSRDGAGGMTTLYLDFEQDQLRSIKSVYWGPLYIDP